MIAGSSKAVMSNARVGRRSLLVLLLGLACGCTKPAGDPPAPDAAASPVASEPATSTTRFAGRLVQGSVVPSTSGAAAAKGASAALAALVPAKTADDDLRAEEPEANPYSETVTLRLTVTPQVKALVMWGGKQVAKLAPGSMDAEIVRPRGSGPVDLEIKAEGFMPHHTRLYTDRNDKVGARLFRPEEAPGLFGYKRPSSVTEKKK
jgi:hypothetical protein